MKELPIDEYNADQLRGFISIAQRRLDDLAADNVNLREYLLDQGSGKREDMDYVERACNSHYGLLAALRTALNQMIYLHGLLAPKRRKDAGASQGRATEQAFAAITKAMEPK